MVSIHKIVCFVLFTAVVLYSCKKDKITTVDNGLNYFPIQVGSYIVYDVDSTFYDDFFTPVKEVRTKFLLKEKVESMFYDNANRLTARLERYVKYYDSLVPYSAMNWTLKNVWVENGLTTKVEKDEENTRYVRLVFPVKLNETWNSNVLNNQTERQFSYISVDVADNIGNIAFDSVLQTEYDDGNSILTSRAYMTEKYARNVGLVYKQEINVQSQPNPDSSSTYLQLFYAKPILERATSGFQYTWTVNSYGIE